jgi:hypothetical protein
MAEELADINALKAWRECSPSYQLPLGERWLATKWVYTRKPPDSKLRRRLKARLVARGDRQSRMPDEDNYASTVLPVVTRMIGVINLSLVASGKASPLIQIDIKKAFLRALGVPNRRVFVKVLQADGSYRYFEVLASLYGLRASPRRWQEKLTADLAEFGFQPCPYCPSLFVCKSRGAIISFHVDDGLLSCTASVSTALLTFLRSKYGSDGVSVVNMMTAPSTYCGQRWTFAPDMRSVVLDQQAFIDALVERTGLSKSFSVWTPQTEILRRNKLAPPDHSYQTTVGSLLWATQTRPDCMYTVKELARNIANTDDSHRAAAQRCVRFLKATRDRALTLKATDKLVITAWIDSAFASCPVTLRSTSGMVIALGSSAVLCRSLTQTTVATSAMEAELWGIFEGLKEILRIRAILAFMGFPQPPTVCHVDTEAGIRALNKRVPSNATKHFDIRFFRILQGIDTQEIALHWVDTETEVADILTKPLCRVKHKRLMDAILNAQLDGWHGRRESLSSFPRLQEFVAV